MKPLISFSGIDSAGKSTQISLLSSYFDKQNKKYKIIWSRGGYTSFFEFIKKLMRFLLKKKLPSPGRNIERQGMFDKKIISKIWYFIAILDLIRLYAITYRFYRLFGYTIIADRYLWDTYIDFKISLKNINIDKSVLWKLAVFFSPKPKKSILLYISSSISFQRSIEKNEPYFDTLDIRVARIELYSYLIKKNKWDLIINTETNDKIKTFTEIKDKLYGI